MNYILDTDTLIYFIKGHPKVVRHLAQTDMSSLHTTVINQAELLFGAFNSSHQKKNLDIIEGLLQEIKILPFSTKSIYEFAQLKAKLRNHGSLIADMDLMIASICLANKMQLVTNNTKHFSHIKDLHIINWAS